MGVPQPEEIYELTRQEGERRLQRPFFELMTTAFAAGFDIAAGLTIYALVAAALRDQGSGIAHLGGSLGFGAGFAFLIVGRGELFTENFLVPLAGLTGKPRAAWWKLAELWTLSPVFNIAAGILIAVLLSVHGVLPRGSGQALVDTTARLHANGPLALFVSAVFAGTLMTGMTWFVEGQKNVLERVIIAWTIGAVVSLGTFDHVIVETIGLVYGIRYGADVPWLFVLGNFGLAAAGNMVGGIGLVTLNRFAQAKAGSSSSA